MLDVEK